MLPENQGRIFPAASKSAGKAFQQGISDSHSLLELSEHRPSFMRIRGGGLNVNSGGPSSLLEREKGSQRACWLLKSHVLRIADSSNQFFRRTCKTAALVSIMAVSLLLLGIAQAARKIERERQSGLQRGHLKLGDFAVQLSLEKSICSAPSKAIPEGKRRLDRER